MKRILFLILCICAANVLFAQARKGGTMYVAIKSLELKSSTGYFASTKGTLAYGAQVTVLQVSGTWMEVRSAANASLTGWAATANLTSKRIVAGSTATASAQEVALAGKGFNQEVENSYKSDGKYNYDDVDKTETQKVSDEELKAFISEGHLSMGE
ncbi:MAG: hypothetical protein FWH41_10890 [Treponema sp.]|nr:hypothetical protein [Treponema sp.]